MDGRVAEVVHQKKHKNSTKIDKAGVTDCIHPKIAGNFYKQSFEGYLLNFRAQAAVSATTFAACAELSSRS